MSQIRRWVLQDEKYFGPELAKGEVVSVIELSAYLVEKDRAEGFDQAMDTYRKSLRKIAQEREEDLRDIQNKTGNRLKMAVTALEYIADYNNPNDKKIKVASQTLQTIKGEY